MIIDTTKFPKRGDVFTQRFGEREVTFVVSSVEFCFYTTQNVVIVRSITQESIYADRLTQLYDMETAKKVDDQKLERDYDPDYADYPSFESMLDRAANRELALYKEAFGSLIDAARSALITGLHAPLGFTIYGNTFALYKL